MIEIVKVLIVSLFIILPFGQLTAVPGLPPGINLYLHDLIISSIIIFYLFSRPRRLPSILKPFFIFSLIGLFSLFLSAFWLSLSFVFISALYWLRLQIYVSLYWILTDSRFKLPLSKLLLFSSLVLALFGLLQYLFLPDTRFLSALNWDDHYYRVIATFGDPSYVGLYLLLGIILTFFNYKKWYFYLILLPPFLLTYSRSSYLALAIVVFTVSLMKKKLHLFILLSISFALLIMFLPKPGGEGINLKRIYSISQRYENWQQAGHIINQKPLLGIGFNTVKYYRQLHFPDSDWQLSHAAAGFDSSLLFTLVTTGLVGTVALFHWLLKIWLDSKPIVRISLLAILIHSLFQNSFFYPWIIIWFVILTACS